MLTLTQRQRVAVDKVVSEPTKAALIASGTGVGKTVQAVEVARGIGAQTVLIIAPLGTAGGWETTFKGQELGLGFRKITSSKAGQQAFHALKSGLAGVYFVGREFFHLSATNLEPKEKDDGTFTRGREALWSWASVHPDLVVYDEVQAVSNRWTGGFKVLKTLKPGFKLAMSATPQGNNFKGIWSVCRWLWPDTKHADGSPVVDRSQWRWAAQWAIVVADEYTGKKIVGEQKPGAFVASLPCYVRDEAEQKPETLVRARVELTPAQRSLYDQMERDALMWLEDNPYSADIPIVQRLRLRQITLGEVTLTENGEIDFAPDCASSKADACLKVIERHPGEAILFWVDSKKFAKVLAQRLPGGVAWTGDVSTAQREEIKADFIAGKFKYLVATIPAMAEGVDGLQLVCHTQVWLNKVPGNATLNTQAAGRLNRTGQEHAITTYELVAPDTDDDDHFTKMVKQIQDQRESLKIKEV